MDEGRAGGGSRDNRSAPTRALLGSYPYQTHTRRDLAITRAARVVLGAFWRRGFSRCSYSSRRGIRVPTYGEYQSDRVSALRQGNPRPCRSGELRVGLGGRSGLFPRASRPRNAAHSSGALSGPPGRARTTRMGREPDLPAFTHEQGGSSPLARLRRDVPSAHIAIFDLHPAAKHRSLS
jgi:hypothetical protein